MLTVKSLWVGYCIAISLLLMIGACEKDRPAQRATDNQASAQPATAGSKSAAADWAMFMRNISYQGISRDTILRPPLAVAWKFKTGGPVNSSPVVAGGTVYIGSDDRRLYALDARRWGVKWEFEVGEKIIYAATVHNGTVYFSARDNKVYALDAATGAKKWEFQADGWINAPVVAFHQKIYFGCYDNKIYTLDAVTGKEKSLELVSIEIGRVRYICSDGEFYPIDAHQRASRWRKKIPASESWPARANGVVYIGARDSRLRAFDYATGGEIWQFQAGGWVDSSPAVSGGMLYVGSHDGYVYAFENAADLLQQTTDRAGKREGVVIRDGVHVYDRLDEKAEIIARLNEGRSLLVTEAKQENWYKVALPDERIGWISASDFTAIRWVERLQVNDSLTKSVTPVTLPKKAEEASWSPNGSTIAFFDDVSPQSIYWRAKSLWFANSDGSDPVWVADGSFYNPTISWSRNGEWIAFENLAGTDRQIWMVRANGTGLRKTADGEAPALSPRGGKVAFIYRDKAASAMWVRELKNDGQIKLVEVPVQGEKTRTAYNYIPVLDPPAWFLGGSRLAVGLDGYHYSDGHSRVVVSDASNGVIREIAIRAERIRNIAWSPDGFHLAYVTQGHSHNPGAVRLDKQVHIVNLNKRGKEKVFENCEGIAWSPDGRYMAFIAENDCMGMRRKVWLLNVESQRLIQLLASREKIHKVFWFTDGRIALLASLPPSETASRMRGWIVSIRALPKLTEAGK